MFLHRKERKEASALAKITPRIKKGLRNRRDWTKENQWTSIAPNNSAIFVDDLVTLRRTAEDGWDFALNVENQDISGRIALRRTLEVLRRFEGHRFQINQIERP